MQTETWRSRIGFIMAAAGSAVGLANIWRFPYLMGSYGGATFIAVYLICIFLIGFPVFISEILMGKTSQSTPDEAFRKMGQKYPLKGLWPLAGKMTIFTGFIVSSFYSAVAGWVMGYLVESLFGRLTHFQSHEQASLHFEGLMNNPWWGLSFHFLFMLAAVSVLILGVRRGIERGNLVMMPTLFILLVVLVIKGLTMPNALEGLKFVFYPDWKALTPGAIILALGQAFFTLSLGQGTMITYGSYMPKNESVLKGCTPVVIMDTLVSLLSTVAVMTIVFSIGMQPSAGPGLIFKTLPLVFSKVPAGYFFAILFFLLVFLAALTSEISAMEPFIAYLQQKGWSRKFASILAGTCAFLVGIPSALSFSILKDWTFHGSTFFDCVNFLSTSILIPLGGFTAVVVVAWVWGFKNVISHLNIGTPTLFNSIVRRYFWFCLKFTAPILIILVFLNALMA